MLASVTIACSGLANAVLMAALCGVPPVAAMVPVARARAAPFKVTLPAPDTDVVTHFTINVCPAETEVYVSV